MWNCRHICEYYTNKHTQRTTFDYIREEKCFSRRRDIQKTYIYHFVVVEWKYIGKRRDGNRDLFSVIHVYRVVWHIGNKREKLGWKCFCYVGHSVKVVYTEQRKSRSCNILSQQDTCSDSFFYRTTIEVGRIFRSGLVMYGKWGKRNVVLYWFFECFVFVTIYDLYNCWKVNFWHKHGSRTVFMVYSTAFSLPNSTFNRKHFTYLISFIYLFSQTCECHSHRIVLFFLSFRHKICL